MTRSELLEAMARGMLGDERYDALRPEIFSYIERKSLPQGAEWASRAEVNFDMDRALSAIEQAGLAVVPVEPTQEMTDAFYGFDSIETAWPAIIQASPL